MLVLFSTFSTTIYTPKVIDCSIKKLNKELVTLKNKGQEIRMKLMPMLADPIPENDISKKLKRYAMITKMQQQDQYNQEYIKTLFTNCDWPKALSKEAHTSIYLILQHSDDALMRMYYPKVEEMVTLGYLDPDDAATMFDRLQMNAGLPQRYGTQTFENTNNQSAVWPIENLEKISHLRATVGLSDMYDYIKETKDRIGVAIVWDKTLTVQDAIRFKK
ncbi:DUF6624 domain-containing protein [uncultured Dokdonia sp.]|uniref:DUF6624 domain-containing protein n=1 Tax=uncultured Dokdonia sp. TaxID=575653 RepID=UPI00260B3667|nr:DUF6624 domain-containing protein [uncultured Dokdonia sp.]